VQLDRSQYCIINVVYFIPDPARKVPGKKNPAAKADDFPEILGRGKIGLGLPGGNAPKSDAPAADLGALYVQTKRGLLHAIDAQTGRTLWVLQVGSRDKPNEAPAVNDHYVAVVNGSDLWVLDRRDGGLVYRKSLANVPLGGLAISKDWVFVPMLTGHVKAFELPDIAFRATPLITGAPKPNGKDSSIEDRDEYRRKREREQFKKGKIATMNYISFAPITVPPLVTRDRMVWTTARGRIYIAKKNAPKALSRFDALKPITAPLTFWPPHIFAASHDGYVYAIGELNGQAKWRFSVGEPMSQPPVPIGDSVFAVADTGGMFCLDSDSGELRWGTPRIKQFIAASATRVYATDVSGALRILDRKSGAPVDALRIDRLDLRITNLRSDRIFLGTRSGVLQCLHEIGQKEPLVHVWPRDVAPALKLEPGGEAQP